MFIRPSHRRSDEGKENQIRAGRERLARNAVGTAQMKANTCTSAPEGPHSPLNRADSSTRELPHGGSSQEAHHPRP